MRYFELRVDSQWAASLETAPHLGKVETFGSDIGLVGMLEYWMFGLVNGVVFDGHA